MTLTGGANGSVRYKYPDTVSSDWTAHKIIIESVFKVTGEGGDRYKKTS